MARFRISPSAKVDLERIWFYGLEQRVEKAADEYHGAFFQHFEELAVQPLLYPESNVRQGYRRSVCGKDSVFYRLDNETVEIMAVLGKEDAEGWL